MAANNGKETDRQKYEFDAFLAYSTEDGEGIVDNISKELQKLNMTCHTNSDIELGQQLIDAIGKAMEKSNKIILIVTEKFLKSRWTLFEIHQALSEAYRRRENALIPILCGIKPEELPRELQDIKAVSINLKQNDADFFPALAQTIREDAASLGDSIPVQNVAFGLAWSYFYGYLKMVLPGMKDRIDKSDFCTDPEKRKINFFRKFIIVLSDNGYCPPSLNEIDPNMKNIGKLTFKANRAGQIQRDYSTTVWEISDPTTQEKYYVAVEFATPLMSLYEMTEEQIAGLSEDAKGYQIKLFQSKMNEIMSHPNAKCKDTVVFMPYGGPCKNPHCSKDPDFAKQVIELIKSYTAT